jgi:hypothetical protein
MKQRKLRKPVTMSVLVRSSCKLNTKVVLDMFKPSTKGELVPASKVYKPT